MDLTTFRELENILLTAMNTPTITVKQVAEETGIKPTCLYKWKRGENRISPDKADAILNWLKETKPEVLDAATMIYYKGGYSNGQ